MTHTYIDRWGKTYTPQEDDVVRSRAGAFLICLHKDHAILTRQQYAMDIPEFPGGGIDPGETEEEAAKREFWEETGVEFSIPFIIDQLIIQKVHFYAENQNEFWDYHQEFYVIKEGLAPLFFDGEKDTPDGGKSFWAPLKDINTLNLHAVHQQAFEKVSL
jgi:8-oxo-dGTP pyrophosphatase MutT (NUDIX family)